MILTDTPEKMELQKQVEESQGKRFKHKPGNRNLDTEECIKPAGEGKKKQKAERTLRIISVLHMVETG